MQRYILYFHSGLNNKMSRYSRKYHVFSINTHTKVRIQDSCSQSHGLSSADSENWLDHTPSADVFNRTVDVVQRIVVGNDLVERKSAVLVQLQPKGHVYMGSQIQYAAGCSPATGKCATHAPA